MILSHYRGGQSVAMNDRRYCGLIFSYVGRILPDRDERGDVIRMMPQARYQNDSNLPLHNYGDGPFCKFRVAVGWRRGGVYVLATAERPLYVGECESLEARWGAPGYRNISPRACFKGGQETNCRINNLIYTRAKTGVQLDLWFLPIGGGKPARADVEDELVACLRPPWNR